MRLALNLSRAGDAAACVVYIATTRVWVSSAAAGLSDSAPIIDQCALPWAPSQRYALRPSPPDDVHLSSMQPVFLYSLL